MVGFDAQLSEGGGDYSYNQNLDFGHLGKLLLELKEMIKHNFFFYIFCAVFPNTA